MNLADHPGSARGSSNDQVRRHNLSMLLGLVHRSRGLSRSQLTRATGLNRSTVAALVAELVERGLVIEVEPDPSYQVGRPSPVVRPDPHTVGVAVNPEVDAITVGAVGLGGQVLGRVRRATDAPPTAAEAVHVATGLVAELLDGLGGGYRAVGVGAAVPGLVRSADGMVRLAPHLGWVDEPFAALLGRSTGLPVTVANDARLGILAEGTFGAGRGCSDLLYLNGGPSGIGGGIVAGGASVTGSAGYAGEFGHTVVDPRGLVCHCGARGCLDTVVRRERLLDLLGLVDADPDQLEAALLGVRAPAALAEVDRQLGFLSVALRNAVNVLGPELIVLGGFLASLAAAAPGRLERLLDEQALPAAREGVRIVRAELGSDLLMIGAAELAFRATIADPLAV